MARFDRILAALEDALHVAGCAALALVALLINVDLLGRLLFSAPLLFQFEVVELYLMPALATLSLSRVYRENAHLALDIIPVELFGAAWPALRVIVLVCSAAFFALVAYKAGLYAAEAFAADKVHFGFIDWPLGWAYLAPPLGCAVLTLRLLTDIVITKSAKSAAH